MREGSVTHTCTLGFLKNNDAWNTQSQSQASERLLPRLTHTLSNGTFRESRNRGQLAEARGICHSAFRVFFRVFRALFRAFPRAPRGPRNAQKTRGKRGKTRGKHAEMGAEKKTGNSRKVPLLTVRLRRQRAQRSSHSMDTWSYYGLKIRA